MQCVRLAYWCNPPIVALWLVVGSTTGARKLPAAQHTLITHAALAEHRHFCFWHFTDIQRQVRDARFSRKSRSPGLRDREAAFDPERTPGP
jgi:hypothetical protein